jgi:hypothetical protein
MSGGTAILMTRLKEGLAKPRPHELKCLKKRRSRFCQTRDVQGCQLSDTAVADCRGDAQRRIHSPFHLSSGGLISNEIVEIQVRVGSKKSKNKSSGDKQVWRYGRMNDRALTSHP